MSWITLVINKFLVRLNKDNIITKEQLLEARIILMREYLPAENRRD